LKNKLAPTLFLCLIGLAILSNRFFVLRQFTGNLNQNSSFHLPIDNATPSQYAWTLKASLANEDDSDPQQFPRYVIVEKTVAGDTLRHSWFGSRSHSYLSPRLPTYILQSSLTI
jgi:hypothetical protein